MIVRRVLSAWLSLAWVAVLAFGLTELLPGDVTSTRLGVGASREARSALRDTLGLEGDVATRAFGYVGRVSRLDLGRSLVDGRSVVGKIAERLPRSLTLAVVALAFTWAFAIAFALRPRRASTLLAISYAMPLPALALAMLSWGAPYGPGVGSILCAALCLQPVLVPRVASQVADLVQSALVDDPARTLRAAGASSSRLFRSALRRKLLPLVTLLALQLPALLSGVVLVEAIFGLPGLGQLAFDALSQRDQPVLLGLVIIGALFTISCTLAVDLAAPFLDPRLRDAR